MIGSSINQLVINLVSYILSCQQNIGSPCISSEPNIIANYAVKYNIVMRYLVPASKVCFRYLTIKTDMRLLTYHGIPNKRAHSNKTILANVRRTPYLAKIVDSN